MLTAVAHAVVKKFGNDDANLLTVALGWYGFTAIYPSLLVVVTALAYVGASSLGNGIVDTLHQFPVIGNDFSTVKGGHNLHGSPLGLTVGLLGLLYGAQGVTQVAVKALARAWNLPVAKRFGFAPRLARSLAGLALIGLAFLSNAFIASFATGSGRGYVARVLLVAAMLAINLVLYAASFRVLTPGLIPMRWLLPGAIFGAVGFTLLITVGTGLIEHQLRGETATYGVFASVIGVVAFLLLLAKLTLYAAELNPVLARSLWPRSIQGEPTEADIRMSELKALEARGREDEGRPEPGEGTSAEAAWAPTGVRSRPDPSGTPS